MKSNFSFVIQICIAVSVILLIAPDQCYSQDTPRDMIERYLLPSYATVGGGINFSGGHGTFTDQLLEAEINQHWHYQPIKVIPKSLRGKFFFKLNPRIRLRMLASDSAPVQTPSFMPNATLFFSVGDSIGDSSSKIEEGKGLTYYTVMLSHHSNGQAGEFYNPDGSINLESGSFSTNFLDIGINRFWGGHRLWQAWTRLSLIWHPGFNRSDELDDQYETVKIALTTRTIRGERKIRGLMLNFEFHGVISYTLDGIDKSFIPGPGSGLATEDASFDDRINVELGISIGQEEIGHLRFYLKYNYGYDYYNIHFVEKLSRIQFGLAADLFE